MEKDSNNNSSSLPFLQQLAAQVYSQYQNHLDQVTLVFPNRRAGLFFRQYLSQEIENPVWSPTIISMEDFVKQYCRGKAIDRFSLVAELYRVYIKHLGGTERFDQFYYWGEMLLSDFDDVDKYLIDSSYLFTDLVKQKELDDYFDYLTEDQRKIILEFWSTIAEKPTEEKRKFQMIWGKLNDIYTEYNEALQSKNVAYSGMQYKQMVSLLSSIKVDKPIIFAGFNALTTSEEKIITHFVTEGAQVVWDYDAYYLEDEKQEAGSFLRSHRDKSVFSKSFQKPYPNNFTAKKNPIKVSAVAQQTGQVKLLGNMLQELQKNKNINLQKTVIVLPDENLLFPLLNSLPSSIESINVTMGFPLTSTPIYSLVEHLLLLQQSASTSKKNLFFAKHVLNVLSHPIVQLQSGEESMSIVAKIEESNQLRVSADTCTSSSKLLHTIFSKVDNTNNVIDYLQEIIGLTTVGEGSSALEKECAFQFYTQLNRIKEVVQLHNLTLELETFIRLFKQIARSMRLPFSGEPLNGLQIMGVLETRNLDFDNVFILSMNEGAFPAAGKGHSFIPYNIRKGYGLPTFDQQDAIYAYLFYRLLQKAQNVFLFYSTEGGPTGGGELSRFVQQLLHESDRPIVKSTHSHQIVFDKEQPIGVEKTSSVFEKLNKYCANGTEGSDKRFTPSALNTYLDCRLRFYFRYVAELFEYNDMQDQIDPMVFGNILHHAMENIYQSFNTSEEREVTEDQVKEFYSAIETSVKEAFRAHFSFGKEQALALEGKQLLAFEMIKKYVAQIIKMDASYAPFSIVGIESKDYTIDIEIEGEKKTFKVGLRGVIDRIDKKGERVRVIDYKTGKDDKNFGSLSLLFDRTNKKRNKAAFQTLLYSLLFIHNNSEFKGAVVPGIINTKEIFSKKFDYHLMMDKEPIVNARPFLSEFDGHLKDLLAEIFSPHVPFDQTDDTEKCNNCPYKGICGK